MRGEELDELFVSYAGVYGDRLFAFHSTGAHKGFPFLTGREQRHMIQYRPRFRNPERAARPINFDDALKLSPNINPVSASADDLMVDVETPDGNIMPIDSPRLIDHLLQGVEEKHKLRLHRSEKAMTDCSPLSIISLQTVEKLSEESGLSVDKRRFRANVYLDLHSLGGFGENDFVGKSFRIGSKAIAQAVNRDGRCMMITLDPDTAEKSPAVLKAVAQAHEGMAGIYAAILVEGIIRKGDPVELI